LSGPSSPISGPWTGCWSPASVTPNPARLTSGRQMISSLRTSGLRISGRQMTSDRAICDRKTCCLRISARPRTAKMRPFESTYGCLRTTSGPRPISRCFWFATRPKRCRWSSSIWQFRHRRWLGRQYSAFRRYRCSWSGCRLLSTSLRRQSRSAPRRLLLRHRRRSRRCRRLTYRRRRRSYPKIRRSHRHQTRCRHRRQYR